MLMCFIPIHLERSTLTLHVLSLIFYPCCCYLMHILTTMWMLHLLHRRVGIFLWVSVKWSKQNNWFSSNFVQNRMRLWHGNSLAPATRKIVNWDGRLGNVTLCGLQVWDMSASLNVASLLCTRITKTCTRETRGRNQCGFTTLQFYNSFIQRSLKLKAQNFFMTIIPLLFISSPPTNNKNIQISFKNFPIIIGCGWDKMWVIKRGVE